MKAEGKPDSAIHYVGNVMIDNLYYQLARLREGPNELKPNKPYAVLTLHRPSNVDDEDKLRGILKAIVMISRELPIYFPAHPRTRKQMEAFGLMEELADQQVYIMLPLPYKSFLSLWKEASLVLTDSGGVQEETTALGIPCFTIRENTERPVTIEEGTNTLVGTTKDGILGAYEVFKNGGGKKGRIPEFWDGKAAERIVKILTNLGLG